ncbi:hypothetical protein Tco_0674598 [Tanacetum coccineum]
MALDVVKGINYLHCLSPRFFYWDPKSPNLLNGKRTVSPLAARKALLSTLIICRSTTPHLACSPVIRAGVSATPEWTRILMRERFYFYYLSTLLARPISGSNYVPSKPDLGMLCTAVIDLDERTLSIIEDIPRTCQVKDYQIETIKA